MPDLFELSAFGDGGEASAPPKAKKRLIDCNDDAEFDFSQDDSLFERIPDVNANRWAPSTFLDAFSHLYKRVCLSFRQ